MQIKLLFFCNYSGVHYTTVKQINLRVYKYKSLLRVFNL